MKTAQIEKTKSVIRSIQSDHENIMNDEPQRFPDAACDGECYRQGDIYIVKRDELPTGLELDETCTLQLAPGTTKGSRHIIDSSDGVEVFNRTNANALQGPFLRLSEQRTVTHPEHGNIVCSPGIYEITYQRAYAEELRRVLD